MNATDDVLKQIRSLLQHYGISKHAVTISGQFGLDLMHPNLYTHEEIPILGVPPALFQALGILPSEADGPRPKGLSWHRESHVVYLNDQVFWLVPLEPMNCLQVEVKGANVHLVEHQLIYALARHQMLGRGLGEVDDYYQALCYTYNSDWGKRPNQIAGLGKVLFGRWGMTGDNWQEQELIWTLAFAQGLVTGELLKRYASVESRPHVRLIGSPC